MELINNQDKPNNSKETVKTNNLPKDNIWRNTERLANVKAPEPKAVLIINKEEDSQKNTEAQNIVEKVVLENEIPLEKSHLNKSGDMVLVCKSTEIRDELKQLVETAKKDISMNSPKTKQVPVTIVGFPKSYEK